MTYWDNEGLGFWDDLGVHHPFWGRDLSPRRQGAASEWDEWVMVDLLAGILCLSAFSLCSSPYVLRQCWGRSR